MTNVKNFINIFKTTAQIGGAQLFNLIIGLIRTKLVALTLGPTGIALIGILQSLMQTCSMAISLGLSNGGTREISLRNKDVAEEPLTLYKSLLSFTILLTIIGTIIFIYFSEIIANYLNIKQDITYLLFGISSSVLSGYFTAIFTGRRMIRQIALISIISGALSLIAAITTLLLKPNYAVAIIVISQPLSLLLVSIVYAPKNTLQFQKNVNFTEIFNNLRPIIRLSLAFLISSLITLCGHLVLRLIIINHYGENGLGQFQAAWTTSILYLGFVITAMGTDYFPRLTKNCMDAVTASKAINEQLEATLLFSTSMIFIMLGTSHIILPILYSKEFGTSANIFQWFLLSDLIKLVCFPLSYLIPARGAAKIFILTELVAMLALLSCTYIILPFVKIDFASVGFIVMYAIYLPIVWIYSKVTVGFRFSKINKKIILSASIFILIIMITKTQTPEYVVAVSVSSAFIHMFYSLTVSDKLFLIAKYLRLKRKSLREDPP